MSFYESSSENLDAQAIEDLEQLRLIRLEFLRKQRRNAESFLKELIDRGLLEKDSPEASVEAVRLELDDQIKTLESRSKEPAQVYMDEVRFYLSFCEAPGA